MIKKILAISLLLLPALMAFAQNPILEEVDTQVWRPFVNALGNNNLNAYKNLHHSRVLRVSSDRKGKIWLGDDYRETYMNQWFESLGKNATIQKIEFSFSERIPSENVVSDQGYYRYTYTSQGKSGVIYGKFHVVSVKENGQWKIILDYDYTDQEKIFNVTEADFLKGSLLR